MAKGKRTKHQREADYVLVNALHLQGYRNWEIANHLTEIRPYSLSNVQVGYDLKRVEMRWQEQTTLELDALKQKELARLAVLEREYWDSFAESKTAGRHGKIVAGDPAYLQGIERCIEIRAKLLGLEAPKRTEHSGYVEISQTTKMLLIGKVERMVERAKLLPSGGPDDYRPTAELPLPKADTAVKPRAISQDVPDTKPEPLKSDLYTKLQPPKLNTEAIP